MYTTVPKGGEVWTLDGTHYTFDRKESFTDYYGNTKTAVPGEKWELNGEVYEYMGNSRFRGATDPRVARAKEAPEMNAPPPEEKPAEPAREKPRLRRKKKGD